MKVKNTIFFILALGLFLGTVYAIGNSTDTTYISSGRWDNGEIANASIDGGNVTTLNIESNLSTTKWAGFKGNLTGMLILSDSQTLSEAFYTWDWTPTSGSLVCAANVSNYDWAGVGEISIAALQTTLDGNYTSGLDRVNNTFTTATCSLTIGGVSVANTANTTTSNPTAITCAVNTTASNIAFCTETLASGAYAVLVAAEATVPYYFYVELV